MLVFLLTLLYYESMDINVIYNQTGRDSLYKTWHTTGANMIIYIKEGRGSIVFADSVFEIKKGVLCFVDGNCQHYTLPSDPNNYARHKVFFNDNILKSGCDILKIDNIAKTTAVFAKIPADVQNEVESSFLKLNDSGDYATRLLSVLQLLNFISRYATKDSTPSQNFALTVMGYINTHFHDNISIDDVCEAVHMSKYHFCRKFKEQTGQTFMEYLLKTRIVQATEFLTKTDMPVGDISDRCGFSSVSYFCRVFKEHTGKSPLQFKKML